MGRRTFESIGKALPGRRNLVVTSAALSAPEIEVVRSLDAARAACAAADKLFVIGGERMYAEALPQAQVLHLTRLQQDFAGDTYFPDFAALPFVLTAAQQHYSTALELYYTFETWLLTSM